MLLSYPIETTTGNYNCQKKTKDFPSVSDIIVEAKGHVHTVIFKH